MTDQFPIPADALENLLPKDAQRQAARLVRESFAAAFRITLDTQTQRQESAVLKLAGHLKEWSGMTIREAQPLRRAVLLAGLDQWGLAFSQVFGPGALSGLSSLVGFLREDLDPAAEAACQGFFDVLQNDEAAGFEFKVETRRELHLSLWHTMIATEEREQALHVLQQLGSMLLSLCQAMPLLGWRLVADALANIQIRCLAHGLAGEGLSQETTQALFAALARDLPEAVRGPVLSQSSQAVVAWQKARRGDVH